MKKLNLVLIVIAILLSSILICVGCSKNNDLENYYGEFEPTVSDNEQTEVPETETPETEALRPETTADGKKASDFVPTSDELVEILKNKYPVMESWKIGKTVNNYKGSMHLYTDEGDMLSVINAADISLTGRFVYKQEKINFGFSYGKTGVTFDIDSYNDTEKIFNFIMTVVFKNVPEELLLTEEEMLNKVVFKEKTKLGHYVYQYTFSGITYEVSKYNDTGNPSYNIIIEK
ncbi:MAG: hypothetical protein IJN17_02895 [Clostridia bacterium]|nr:hypothetical protein [Clostridia bacterium]